MGTRRKVSGAKGSASPSAVANESIVARDRGSGLLASLDTYRQSIPLHWFAFISAILHLSCLVLSLNGLITSDYSVSKDEKLILMGFVAYLFDIVATIVLGRSYFYR